MASDVLREYLFKLAFRVDKNSSKEAQEAQKKQIKIAKMVVGALWDASKAVVGMVNRFAEQMDKLYYSSQRAGATAARIQAIEYAASRVGIEGGKLTAIMEGLNTAFQVDPGKRGMVEAMGIDTAQDKAAVLVQLMEKLFAMDDIVGARMAQTILGMHEADYLQLKRNRAEFYKYVKEKQDAQERAGVDMDKAAEAGHRYSNALKTIGDRLGTIKDIIALNLLEPFEGSVNLIIDGLDWVIARLERFMNAFGLVHEAMGRYVEGIFTLNPKEIKGAGKILWDALKGAFSTDEKPRPTKPAEQAAAGQPASPGAQPQTGQPATTPSPKPTPVQQLAQSLPPTLAKARAAAEEKYGATLASIEQKRGLPSGLLLGIMGKESSYGRNLVGPTTRNGDKAQGPMQFMPATAREYGINPMDFQQSFEAAGKKMQGLIKMFKGDTDKALAAYNWGEGNLMKAIKRNQEAGLPTDFDSLKVPQETRDYVNTIRAGKFSHLNTQTPSVTLQQTNTYHISSPNPQAAASAVGAMHDRTNADAVRNLGGVIR